MLKKPAFWFIFILIYVNLIFVSSSLPGDRGLFLLLFKNNRLDLAVHGLTYMILSFAIMRLIITANWFQKPAVIFTISLLCAITVGGGVELLQRYIPNRVPSWSDMAANIAGAVIPLFFSVKKKKR